MKSVLGLGLAFGLLTAIWCILSGGSVLAALLTYSLTGTLAALVAGFVVTGAAADADLDLLPE